MRPKVIALIAVSAVALVGCASGEPGTLPTISSDPAAEALKNAPEGSVYDPESQKVMSMEEYVALDAPVSEIEKVEPVEAVEEQFADFAELRAPMNEAKIPDRAKVIEGLHDFCEDDKPFNVSKTEDLNKNLDAVAESAYCDRLESK